MGRGKKYQPEQVVNLLRQVEVVVANGKTTALACKEAGDCGADVLPLAQGVRRVAGRPGEAAEGAGAGAGEHKAKASGCEPYRSPAPEARLTNDMGMEKWKPLRASHFFTPLTAAT